MSAFVIRRVPEQTWLRFRERAALIGWPLTPLIIRLMQDFAAGQIDLEDGPLLDPVKQAAYVRRQRR